MAGATPLGNMVIKLGLDDADFGRGVANSKKQVTYLAKEMSANMKIADIAGDKLGKLGTRYDSLTQIMKAQQNQVAALKKSYEDSFVDGKATDSTKRLAAQLQDANGKLAGYQGQLQNTAGQLARLQVETQGFTGRLNRFGDSAIANGAKLTAIGDGASKIGGTLTKSVTIPLVALGAAAVKASVDYESAFAGVKKTVDEQVDSNGKVIISYDDLSNGIRAMAKELPASASEIAAVAEQAGQLGIKTQDVLSFSRTMIDLGESTNMSATDAATAIAKIANITGMTSDQYQRFGSSVTALGNNFATTESDIIMMTNRLASSGTLAGLTNQEMLGLATAMSSVGIEAEAGGTAMTQTLSAMETAASKGAGAFGEIEDRAKSAGLTLDQVSHSVSKGGKELKTTAAAMGMTNKELRSMYDDASKASDSIGKFAEISGMSSEQFAIAWKDKPIEAIQAFIKGLGQLSEKGESATMVLDDMGLGGIRQSNMLKSLALASDTLTGAVSMSTQAWDENTALTAEANKRYETTESKLKMLKNEVTDVAIEFGGPLVDALRDGVQASKPVIQFLGDMAKKFSSLDKEQQQNIVKWALIAASAGPALSIFGKISSVAGGTVTSIGKLSKSLVDLAAKASEKKAVESMASGITNLGVSATSASSGVTSVTNNAGALAKALPFVTNPLGLAVGATALLATGLVALSISQDAARRETEKWGVKLSGTTKNELAAFKDKLDNTKDAIDKFEAGASSANKVGKAFSDMYVQIKKAAQEADTEVQKAGERLGLTNEQIEKGKANNAQYVKNAETMSQQVVAIYEKHNSDSSQLTAQEKEIVLNNQKEMIDAQLNLMKLSSSEKKSVMIALNGDINQLNRTQLENASKHLETLMSKENESYSKERDDLKSALESKMITQKEYDTKYAVARDQHNAVMESYGTKYLATMNALDRAMQASGMDKTATGIWQKTRDVLNKYGDGMYDKIIAKSYESGKAVFESSGMVAKYTAKMSTDGKAASDQWNALVFDPKTGEMKQNAKEEVAQALQAEGGWNQMQFILKNANLETNAKIKIAEALVANGQWENLKPEEKKLVIDNKQGLQAIFDSKENLKIWDSIPEQVKRLLANNEDFLNKKDVAQSALDAWIKLTPEQKMLTAQNMTGQPTSDAQATINSLLGKEVGLFANNSTIFGKDSAQGTVNTLTGKTVGLNANNNTWPGVNDALNQLGKVPSTQTVTLVASTSGFLASVNAAISGAAIAAAAVKLENGTNYHRGGLAMVNDQSGPLYKEIISLPDGNSFIPQGRNVMLPLPKGSKVIRASRTKSIMERAGIPKYADGVGIPEDSKLIRNLRSVTAPQSNMSSDSGSIALLAQAIENMKKEVTQKIVIEHVTWTGKDDINELLQQLAQQEIINARGGFG